jgi:hypothetical protein
MGLLDGTTQKAYYQGSEKGSYQFTSLEDVINYFMVVYVGEGKTVSKINRTDVAFHAQRAMQELSFDTFKSVKSQEILLPPSNTMVLPHDYVNYTKISWSDAAGVKHPLYPTSNTSNPFKVLQEADGSYDFVLSTTGIFLNGSFDDDIVGPPNGTVNELAWKQSKDYGNAFSSTSTTRGVVSNRYEWRHVAQSLSGSITGRHQALWQEINVTEIDFITLSAKGLSSSIATGKPGVGIVRIGFSTQVDLTAQNINNQAGYNPDQTTPILQNVGLEWKQSRNMDTTIYDVPTLSGGLNYIQFDAGDDTLSAATELVDIDVSNLTGTVYLLAVSSGGDFDSNAVTGTKNAPNAGNNTEAVNAIDDIVLSFEVDGVNIQSGGDSTTWSNYKSHTPNNNVDRYDDGTYDLVRGERYGIDPQHAQVNGSYYIDNLRGLINFSSNVSGKTVILDYISDSLGTDGEMQVHKFAEEAMYKWIMYAVLSTRANTPEYIVRRYQKEKFAATRTAKLRLSNIKLEELTQILRGKSKWIKH